MLSKTRRSIAGSTPGVEHAFEDAKVYSWEHPGRRACYRRREGLSLGAPRASQAVERALESAKVYSWEHPGCRGRSRRREGLSVGAPRPSQGAERALGDAKVYPCEPPGCRARARIREGLALVGARLSGCPARPAERPLCSFGNAPKTVWAGWGLVLPGAASTTSGTGWIAKRLGRLGVGLLGAASTTSGTGGLLCTPLSNGRTAPALKTSRAVRFGGESPEADPTFETLKVAPARSNKGQNPRRPPGA